MSIFQESNLKDVKIATGSYVGTGVYGSSNPNRLTFDFVPKFVVCINYISRDTEMGAGFIWAGQTGDYSNLAFSVSGKTFSWYTTNQNGAGYQLNASGTRYYYIAIG